MDNMLAWRFTNDEQEQEQRKEKEEDDVDAPASKTQNITANLASCFSKKSFLAIIEKLK